MNKEKFDWISEEEAARLMGYKPKVFRRYCYDGKLPIIYTRVNYKTYEYCRNSINKYKADNSSSIYK